MSEIVTVTATYLLFYIDGSLPIPFYVGESVDPATRLSRHRRDAADPSNAKEAYEFLRANGIKEFDMEVVDGITERQLVTELTRGYRLYNSNAGVSSTTKKAKTLSTFAALNREAEAILTIKEQAEASGRRNHRHGDAQQLTKSEVV